MILTSDGRLLKMDPTKKFKVMLSIPLSDITQVTMSPDGGNQVSLTFYWQLASILKSSLCLFPELYQILKIS